MLDMRHFLYDREYYILAIRVFGPTEAEKLMEDIPKWMEFYEKHNRRFDGIKTLRELQKKNQELNEIVEKLPYLLEIALKNWGGDEDGVPDDSTQYFELQELREKLLGEKA